MKGRKVYGTNGKPDTHYLDGKEVSREEYDAAFPDQPLSLSGPSSLTAWHKPILSDGLAVHPKQIPAVMERNRKYGVHIEYNQADGRPILQDRGARRQLLRIEKMHDRSGGYGD